MHSGNNSIGGVPKVVNFEQEMTLFDSLPRVIREELVHAPIDYAVQDINAAWNEARLDGLSAYDFKNWMSQAFRENTRSLSATGVENGSYKITRRLKTITSITGLPTVPRARTRF